jgi:hypothetical protein
MYRSITTFAFGMGLFASLAVAGPAAAEDTVPANGSAAGEVMLVFIDPLTGAGAQVWSATGKGTVLGDHTTTGVTFFAADGSTSGIFHAAAHDGGDSVSGIYSGGPGALDDDGNLTGTVTVIWTAGTGRLEGVSGTAEVDTIQGPFDDSGLAIHSYKYRGKFVLP